MNIQDFVNEALNTLKEIAIDGNVETELRISAAEKILDYAAKLDEKQEGCTEAIGFKVEVRNDGQFGVTDAGVIRDEINRLLEKTNRTASY